MDALKYERARQFGLIGPVDGLPDVISSIIKEINGLNAITPEGAEKVLLLVEKLYLANELLNVFGSRVDPSL